VVLRLSTFVHKKAAIIFAFSLKVDTSRKSGFFSRERPKIKMAQHLQSFMNMRKK